MSPSRQIDVRRQRNLTTAETLRLCVKGISHRLLRSVLTLAVVTLAVAFFMFLMSENVFVSAVGEGVTRETARQRFSARFLSRVLSVPPEARLAEGLAAAIARPAEFAEYGAIVGWSPDRIEGLAANCRRELEYTRFFERLPVGKRTVLVQKRRGRDMFRPLRDAAEWVSFEERVKPMIDVQVPGGLVSFQAFVNGLEAYEEELRRFAGLWAARIQANIDATQAMATDAPAETWLRGTDGAGLEAWGAMLRGRGFDAPSENLSLLQEQLRADALKREIFERLSRQATTDAWRREFKGKRMSTDEKMLKLGDPRVPALLENRYTPAQLAATAAGVAYEQRLGAMERRLSGTFEAGSQGTRLSGRQLLLLVISFLVCMTGIANAMLMSITERFREIATMKCLGATDRFILVQFMMEAGLQGVVGGSLGMLLGWIISLLRNGAVFGAYVFTYWSGLALLGAGGLALLTGMVLAIMASVYPAWAASRMAPMEAMRVE